MFFYPIMNVGHFWAPSPMTFHSVKNHGGGGAEGEPRGIVRERRTKENKENNTQRKTKTNRNKTTKKDAGSGTNKKVRVFLGQVSSRVCVCSTGRVLVSKWFPFCHDCALIAGLAPASSESAWRKGGTPPPFSHFAQPRPLLTEPPRGLDPGTTTNLIKCDSWCKFKTNQPIMNLKRSRLPA